jgi:nicotinamidase-related amidase
VAPRADEPVVHKTVNSGFIGTDLEQRLRDLGVPGVVLAGLTTDHCVSTTARMSANLGFDTWLVADACATFDRRGADGRTFPAELVHEVALASLHDEFATVLTGDQLLGAAP